MLFHIFDILYLKTYFFSVQTRIIVTFLILLHSLTESQLSLDILELFYFSLVYTLTGQVYIDIKKRIYKKPFNTDDIYGYIMKIALIYYCTSILKLKLTYSGFFVSSLFMLLYKLNYDVFDVYELTFKENIYIFVFTLGLLLCNI